MRPPRTGSLRARVRLPAAGTSLLIVALALGGAVAGCSKGGDAGATAAGGGSSPTGATTVLAEVPMGSMHMPTADEVTATWEARPEYVRALPGDWQSAYAYALARPDVLQWLPCYCGCGGMGHRSNLDCFFQRREVKGTYQYEEHASYCDICIKTANMADAMLREGKTMTEIRAAVDSTFGGGAAPGTDTALPPA